MIDTDSDHCLECPGGWIDLWNPAHRAWLARRCRDTGRTRIERAIRVLSVRTAEAEAAGYPSYPDGVPPAHGEPMRKVNVDPSTHEGQHFLSQHVALYRDAAMEAWDDPELMPTEVMTEDSPMGRLVAALEGVLAAIHRGGW